MSIKSILPVFFICGNLLAQTYTHPTIGLNSTWAGACLVNTCSGTYYDNGGAGGNYAANINSIYRTFCPNTAGTCVRATFTSWSMNDTYFLCFGPNSCCDYLTIHNGAVFGTPVLYNNCTTSPGTVTATGPNGCLTFRHTTDGSVQLAGWAATLSCVACAGGPAANTRHDCPGAIQVCTDSPISYNSTGPGLISESCSGCSSAEGEIHSSWYVFQMTTGGTLGLTIIPTVGTDDFDFVLYGPNTTCGALGSPIRCSYAGTSGNTGMGNGAVDNSEIVTGDGWVSTLNVTAGQIYRLQVNHWNPPTSGYTLDWNLTGGASLNCTPLAVQLTDFRCEEIDNSISVYWSTSAEVNSDYFIVEKSTDGENFTEFTRVQGQGNSTEQTEYIITDLNAAFGVNYYRLKQVDLDGHETVYDMTSCNFGNVETMIKKVTIYNLSGMVVYSSNENTTSLQKIVSQVHLQPGMYILETIDENDQVKIIKFVQI